MAGLCLVPHFDVTVAILVGSSFVAADLDAHVVKFRNLGQHFQKKFRPFWTFSPCLFV